MGFRRTNHSETLDGSRFQHQSLAAAEVGNNKVSGQTYTNTIDFGITSQKPFFIKRANPLREVFLTKGFK
jgi:hypothetical protein